MNIRTSKKTKIAVAVGAGALLAGGIAGTAFAGGGDDDETDRPIPAGDLEQASDAALAETGGGTVTGTEVNDEESKYEVEVTLDDGTQVDVQLDQDFNVVSTENDGADDESGDDD